MSTLHTTRTALRTTVLLPFTPFIGLAFILVLPVAGLVMLAGFAVKALAPQARLLTKLRDVALFVAAPFVGLAYVLAMPAVGLLTLAWLGGRAVARHVAAPSRHAPALHAA